MWHSHEPSRRKIMIDIVYLALLTFLKNRFKKGKGFPYLSKTRINHNIF